MNKKNLKNIFLVNILQQEKIIWNPTFSLFVTCKVAFYEICFFLYKRYGNFYIIFSYFLSTISNNFGYFFSFLTSQ